LSSSTLEEEKENNPKKVMLIRELLNRPKRLLATILVANNFINIAVVLLFSSLGELFFSNIETGWIKLLVEVVLITFFILLFGEILPKIYANRNNLRFAKIMARPIYNLDRYVLFFLSIPMSGLTLFLEKTFGQKSGSFSVDQLSQALELTNQRDTTQQEEQILKGIVSFGNTDTKQVMCPRVDVFALSTSQSLEEIVPLIIEHGFSRIPVYNERLDDIAGILYSKDLMPNLTDKQMDWKTLLRPAYFVPENKKLDDLLKEFQQKKIHIAVVVDEYGGTSGVVTLEDLIEEIVGDISDEFDDEDVEYSKINTTTFVFEAKVSLKDFYRITQIEDTTLFEKAKGEAETLGGFVLEVAKQLPKIQQKIKFDHCEFTVESVDRKRIKRLKVNLAT
jgi:gliding motility-associated protein GldE